MNKKITIDHLNGLQYRVRMDFPVGSVNDIVEEQLRELGKTLKLKGFRKGKIPYEVVRDRYGDEIRKQVLDELMQQALQEVAEKENLEFAGQASIDNKATEQGDDITIVVSVEVYPQFTVMGIEELTVEKPVVEIGQADVDELIHNLRKRARSWQGVNRQAQAGDRVMIDFEGKLDGGLIEGGKRRAVPVVIGEGAVSGVTEQRLTGLSAGNEIEIEAQYSAEFSDTSLAGKTIRFWVRIREVAEEVLPEVDRKFCKSFGIESGELEDLRSAAIADMEREAEVQLLTDIKLQLFGQLLEQNTLELPTGLVEEEAGRLQHLSMQRDGLIDISKAPPVSRFLNAAGRNVHMGLLIRELFTEQGMQILREEINDKIIELCPPGQEPGKYQEQCYQDPELLGHIENTVMDEKVVNWLMRKAKTVEKPMSFSGLVSRRGVETGIHADILPGIPDNSGS
ncbi:MAG: trigger factor [Chromatiales bacterium]|jgi:trigger factor|nr:trigger factor [Chromatiales bacterium]